MPHTRLPGRAVRHMCHRIWASSTPTTFVFFRVRSIFAPLWSPRAPVLRPHRYQPLHPIGNLFGLPACCLSINTIIVVPARVLFDNWIVNSHTVCAHRLPTTITRVRIESQPGCGYWLYLLLQVSHCMFEMPTSKRGNALDFTTVCTIISAVISPYIFDFAFVFRHTGLSVLAMSITLFCPCLICRRRHSLNFSVPIKRIFDYGIVYDKWMPLFVLQLDLLDLKSRPMCQRAVAVTINKTVDPIPGANHLPPYGSYRQRQYNVTCNHSHAQPGSLM